MKVKNSGNSHNITGENLFVEHKKDFASQDQNFERHFSELSKEKYEQYIAELTQKIDEQGARLAKRADIGEMERYRMLISELLNEVVGNAYAVNKEKIFDSKGKQKIYITVNKINEKLEKMARDIISGNMEKLELISSIDEIRGLIIDVFL